jgi:hypothetical protein
MRHLTLLHAHGFRGTPQTIAELGPGETLGVGLCGLLSGADRYIGLDVIAHSDPASNQQVLKELIPLFRARAHARVKGWPDFSGWLDGQGFPSHILTDDILERATETERLDAVYRAVTFPSVPNSIAVEYKAPWSDPGVIEKDSVDLIVSASVLEHVVDLRGAYQALYRWLKPGGWMSHQIDLKAHNLTKRWNGFRTCSEGMWKLAFGRRPYMINRSPASMHLELLAEAGFKLVTVQKMLRDDGIRREELAPRWAGISDEDLNCSALYVIAIKQTPESGGGRKPLIPRSAPSF